VHYKNKEAIIIHLFREIVNEYTKDAVC